MKTYGIMAGLLVALALAASVASAQKAGGAGAGAGAAGGGGGAGGPQWTLLCQTFTGPTHAQQAKAAKEYLVQNTKLRDWYVVTGDAESNLYYGFYRSYDDAKDADAARAQKDRRAVADVVDAAGNKPFQFCVFQPIAGSDPSAPPEWDLRNAKGYFSWEIAVYMDSPERKQAAVDAVREARKQGVEAYYFHGPSKSSVCIGAWPREAVREQESAVARTSNPDEPVLVSTTPLPGGGRNLRLKGTDERVKAMTPTFEPVDPTMIEVMKTYPTHSINGERAIRRVTDPNTGKVTEIEDPAFPVIIPQKEETIVEDPALREQAEKLGVVQQPSNAPKRGAGRLKSIGE